MNCTLIPHRHVLYTCALWHKETDCSLMTILDLNDSSLRNEREINQESVYIEMVRQNQMNNR